MLKKRYYFVSNKLRGEYIFLLTHLRAHRPKLKPVDLGDEFGVKLENTYTLKIEDTGSLKHVHDVITNLMIKEVNEEFEKVSNNKDNAMNKICNVYSDLLKDKENVNYNDIKTVSETVNKIIEK